MRPLLFRKTVMRTAIQSNVNSVCWINMACRVLLWEPQGRAAGTTRGAPETPHKASLAECVGQSRRRGWSRRKGRHAVHRKQADAPGGAAQSEAGSWKSGRRARGACEPRWALSCRWAVEEEEEADA